MQISVSSTLTVYHDGQFWVGLAEHVEGGRYGVARIVFGAEPSDEEILRFVVNKWTKLAFFGDEATETSKPAKNPKRRAREAAKALKRPAVSTKGAAGTRGAARSAEARIGPRKKPTPRGRGRGALRAAKAETQTEASRALIGDKSWREQGYVPCSRCSHIQQQARIRLKPCLLSGSILLYRTSILLPASLPRK